MLPCSTIDSKKFIYLRHDPDRALIFGIDFDRLEELSPGMRPARRVDDSGSADMIVSPGLKVTKSRWRLNSGGNYGRFQIVDPHFNSVGGESSL